MNRDAAERRREGDERANSMTTAVLTAYRGALGERFAPQKTRADGWLERRDAERLGEALREVYSDADRLDPSPATLGGARLAAGFGVSPSTALRRALGAPDDLDAAADDDLAARRRSYRLAWRLAAEGFGEALFAAAKHTALLGEETLLADPLPGLIDAACAADEGWSATGLFVESALRTLAACAPLIEAGRVSVASADAADRIDERAAAEQRRCWSAAIDALRGDRHPASDETVAAAAAGYGRLSAAGDAEPVFPAPDQAGSPVAKDFAAMAAVAEAHDLRALKTVVDRAPALRRDALAEARWDGWSDDADDLPRLDADEGRPIVALDLGPAPDPSRLPMAEAVALALGDEAIDARRAILADIALDAAAGRAPTEEAADRLSAWRRLSSEHFGRTTVAEAFQSGWRARRDLRVRPALSDAAALGLGALAEDWPEQPLLRDLADDADRERRFRSDVKAEEGERQTVFRRRGGSFSLIPPNKR